MEHLPLAKKSLGQHWLTDPEALAAICKAGEITPDDTVLEIGPGTGTLTRKLLEQVGQVIAVELDENLAKKLEKTLSTLQIATKLQIVRQDILSFDLTGLPPDYKVVANIPYYLTSKLIRVLSETPNQASRLVILVQKEVAARVAATPGDMSLLSVSAQFYWQVQLGREVPARLFTPPPKVDSQILIMSRREHILFPDVDEKQFFRLVKAGFSARRKTLLNSLAGGLRREKREIEAVLVTAGISPQARPQTLALVDWHALYQAANSATLL